MCQKQLGDCCHTEGRMDRGTDGWALPGVSGYSAGLGWGLRLVFPTSSQVKRTWLVWRPARKGVKIRRQRLTQMSRKGWVGMEAGGGGLGFFGEGSQPELLKTWVRLGRGHWEQLPYPVPDSRGVPRPPT